MGFFHSQRRKKVVHTYRSRHGSSDKSSAGLSVSSVAGRPLEQHDLPLRSALSYMTQALQRLLSALCAGKELQTSRKILRSHQNCSADGDALGNFHCAHIAFAAAPAADNASRATSCPREIWVLLPPPMDGPCWLWGGGRMPCGLELERLRCLACLPGCTRRPPTDAQQGSSPSERMIGKRQR